MAFSAEEVPFEKPEITQPVEFTGDTGNDEMTNAVMPDAHSGATTNYFSGFSNQVNFEFLRTSCGCFLVWSMASR